MRVWAKTKEFSEGKFLVVRRDGTTPEWPHFVIRCRMSASTIGSSVRCGGASGSPLPAEPRCTRATGSLTLTPFFDTGR